MAFYIGNDIDTTTKDVLTKELINKIVSQRVNSEVFKDTFAPFRQSLIGKTGFQVEEYEVGNLTATDFDPTGAKALTKANMNFKALYHKINNKKTYQATVSDKQVKIAMMNEANMSALTNAITNELLNSSKIDDYENVKTLFKDIIATQKKMTLVDLNGNFDDMDAFTKAIQTLATKMTFPSTKYNFLGFKKEFNDKSDLCLVLDAPTLARLNVDSLAMAFNMDKKDLVGNVLVIDEMPVIEFATEKGDLQDTIDIGTKSGAPEAAATPIKIVKPKTNGGASVTGKVRAILVNKKAIICDPIERQITEQYNAAGMFTNYFLHTEDMLSYSPFRNALALVD